MRNGIGLLGTSPSSSNTIASGSISALTTDIALLPRTSITRDQTAVALSRSLRNLENQAGGGGVRQQAALGVGDAGFCRGGAAADIEGAACGAHRAGILGHAADEGDLEFERGVAGARRQRGLDRKSHRGIQ